MRAREKVIPDLVETCSSDSSGNIDTDHDDDDGECNKPTRLHLSRSSTHTGNNSTSDSGIAFDDTSQCRSESVTQLRLKSSLSGDHNLEAPEPFPEVDPLVLAIDLMEPDDPPNIEGLKIGEVEVYLERLRDDPVFGSHARGPILPVQIHKKDAIYQALDTHVDFSSVSVSQSSSSLSLKDLGGDETPYLCPEKEPQALQLISHATAEIPIKLPDPREDPYGPRYQLADETLANYVKRVTARFQATLAKHERPNRHKTLDSSSSSINSHEDDFSTSQELSFNDTDTCPSSPPTPYAPHRTPLNKRNLAKLEGQDIIDVSNEDGRIKDVKPEEPDSASGWSPPSMIGEAVFDISETRMTPPRKQVYKHIDFCPLELFHNRGIGRRYVILEQDCLQCVLKNMKCDDFHPCCKRCIRSGDAPHCIRQRRLASWELEQLGLEDVSGYTVLIRMPEDSDEVWSEKLRKEELLLEELEERIDRRNWVMPMNDGVQDIYLKGQVQGRQLCEERGKIYRYNYTNQGGLW